MQKIKKSYNFNILLLLFSPIILSLITVIFYYPSLNYAFQFDDRPNILKFFNIRNLDFNSLVFTNARWMCTWLNTINFHIGKFEPFTYRCFNLAFHVFTGILVFFFFYLCLSRLKENNFFKKNYFSISLFTALLFLLHPVQTQTVSYIIQGRLEGIATFFVIAICLCFLVFTKIKNIFFKSFFGILLFILTILSTGTKEIAIVAPFLVMLTDWFFVAQGSFNSYKKRIPIHLLLLFITFGFYIFYLKPKFFVDLFGLKLTANNNMGNILTRSPVEQITSWYFFISQFKVILHYLFIFIWPFNISVEYDWKLANSFFDADALIPFLILICIGIFIIFIIKKNKINPIAFGLIWFFISIAPRSSIIPSSELMADYKTYLASIGWLFVISIAIIKGYYYLSNKLIRKKFSIIILFSIFMLLLGFMTYSRNLVWRSALEFWGNIIKNAEKSRALNNYGVELSNLERFQESIPYFKKSIKLDPTYCDPYTNLASAYAILGKMDLAIITLKESLELSPYQPEAYNNLGTFLMYKEDLESAEKCFIAALAMIKHYGKAMLNYGRLYLMQGNIQKAWEYFKKTCTESDFDMNPEAFEFYGNTSLSLKKYGDAIFAFNKMFELSQNQQQKKEALFSLGNAYFLDNQMETAANIFNEMIQQFYTDHRGWCNLIEAYISMKNFDKALEIIKKAKLNKIYFEGMEIQQAKILALIGHKDLANKILNEFIDNSRNEKLKNMAQELIAFVNQY